GQSVSAQREVFPHRSGQIGAVGGDAAGKNEFENLPALPVDLADSLHNPGSSSYIDLPHALDFGHAGTNGVNHKGQVDYGAGLGFLQQSDQLQGAGLIAQI